METFFSRDTGTMILVMAMIIILISIPSKSFSMQHCSYYRKNNNNEAHQSLRMMTNIAQSIPMPTEIWYNDPTLSRANNVPISSNDVTMLNKSRFMLLENNEKGKVCHLVVTTTTTTTTTETEEIIIQNPLFFTFHEIQQLFNDDDDNDDDEEEAFRLQELIEKGEIKKNKSYHGGTSFLFHSIFIWLGNHSGHDNDDLNNNSDQKEQHWAIYSNRESLLQNDAKRMLIMDAAKRFTSSNNNKHHDSKNNEEIQNIDISFIPLREFGDTIQSSKNAAICSLANGLTEFHKSHLFCSYCGSSTSIDKYGSSRNCCNSKRKCGGSCIAPSIYPRIDVASIMLITSSCENYVLLGRKKSWPKGRYSTLAGFLEMGETIEQCCIRETFEESGVKIDPNSVRFVKSQPWPFPRSLMVGYRAKALFDHGHVDESDDDRSIMLPKINFDEKEMEDVKWFHKEFVSRHLEGGSTALQYNPSSKEEKFHIPGKASLARYLIMSWALEQ